MQTRQQKMAQIIYDQVRSVKGEKWEKEYGRLCLNFPSLLHLNGLCQVVAFYEAKGADEEKKPYYKKFLRHLTDTVNLETWDSLRTMNSVEYRRLTRIAFQAASWYKRYAEAILKVEQGDDSEGDDAQGE